MIYEAFLLKLKGKQPTLLKVALGVALLSLGSTTTHAALFRTLDEFKTIEVPIAKKGLTRIAVKGDRIAHVFGVTGEYVLSADDDQGQIFIRPIIGRPVTGSNSMMGNPMMENPLAEETKGKPLNLTLTTEGGKTQDLCLTPRDQNPEAIILKADEDAQKSSLSQKHNQAPLMREEIEDLIQAAREGRIPLGYKSVPLDLRTLQGPYLLVRELKGEKLRCLTYEVHNQTGTPLPLSEADFATMKELLKSAYPQHSRISPPIAISLSKKILNPQERGLVYVVVRTLP